jgi:UDP-N-acetylglucosamine acyltransferase
MSQVSMIDPRADVHPRAKIAENVIVGPWTIIEEDVEIGSGTHVYSHVVIRSGTRIGKNNKIFQFSSIGEECQDKKYKGEPTRLEIGDNNIFREACTIHRGTIQDKSLTSIGSHNLFMVNVHIAHDVVVGNHCIIANDSNIAGHCHIDDYAILAGSSQMHQFCRIGKHAMTGGASVIFKDIPAYVMCMGYPAVPKGLNVEGLKRRGFEKTSIQLLRRAYKIIYRENNTIDEAIELLKDMAKSSPEVDVLLTSVNASTRGLAR